MNRIILLLLTLLLSATCSQHVENVAEWRGPYRSGVYHETNLLKSWPENGPELIWENNELGSGYGSPVIADDRLFVIGSADSTSYLISFKLNGEKLFQTAIGNEWAINFPGSRGTPTIAGNLAYTLTGKGDLAAVDINTGGLIWEKSMVRDYEGQIPRFGYAESPIVDGDRLICIPGGPFYNVVALNRFTGELIWNCEGKGERSAYNSAALFKIGGRKIVAAFSAYHLLSIDAQNGQLLWVHEQTNTPTEKREPGTGDTHGNTIVFNSPMLYYVEGDGNCAVALKLADNGLSYQELWTNKEVNNYMGGIVLIDNNIYSCAFSKNTLVSIDATTGEVTASATLGRGALVAADSMLYYYNNRGEMHLVDYQNNSLKSVSMFKIEKGTNEHFAHPVIQNGILYIRRGEFLGAYQIF